MYSSRIAKVRQSIVIICYTLTASIFWGTVGAALVRYAFKVEPGYAMVIVGIPIGTAVAAYLLPKMRKLLGFI